MLAFKSSLHQYGPTLIPAQIRGHMSSKVCDEITYSFQNSIVEVWGWVSNSIPHGCNYIVTLKVKPYQSKVYQKAIYAEYDLGKGS